MSSSAAADHPEARFTLRGLIGLLRPLNATLSAVGIAVGALAAVGPGALAAAPLTLVLAMLTAWFGTAYGNVLNDLHDHALDQRAHPERPLPSGRMTRLGAWKTVLLLWFATIGLGAFVGTRFLFIVVLLLMLLYAYERRLKVRGLLGNLAVAVAAGALFPLGGYAFDASPGAALILGLLAALAHLGRELQKDAQDASADRAYRRTFATQNGPRAAARLGAAFLITAVLVSPLPHTLHGWSDGFLLALIVPDAVFLVAAWRGLSDARSGQMLSKAGMILALVAFAIGAVL